MAGPWEKYQSAAVEEEPDFSDVVSGVSSTGYKPRLTPLQIATASYRGGRMPQSPEEEAAIEEAGAAGFGAAMQTGGTVASMGAGSVASRGMLPFLARLGAGRRVAGAGAGAAGSLPYAGLRLVEGDIPGAAKTVAGGAAMGFVAPGVFSVPGAPAAAAAAPAVASSAAAAAPAAAPSLPQFAQTLREVAAVSPGNRQAVLKAIEKEFQDYGFKTAVEMKKLVFPSGLPAAAAAAPIAAAPIAVAPVAAEAAMVPAAAKVATAAVPRAAGPAAVEATRVSTARLNPEELAAFRTSAEPIQIFEKGAPAESLKLLQLAKESGADYGEKVWFVIKDGVPKIVSSAQAGAAKRAGQVTTWVSNVLKGTPAAAAPAAAAAPIAAATREPAAAITAKVLPDVAKQIGNRLRQIAQTSAGNRKIVREAIKTEYQQAGFPSAEAMENYVFGQRTRL